MRRLRAAYGRSHQRAESAGETVLRVFHDAMDVPVDPQVDLVDAEGRLLGRADLLVTGTGNVHEYDGSGHRKRDQQRSDLRRERRLAGTPYVRRGFTLDDLLNHPGVVMHELDRALGRSASGPSPEAVAPADGPLDVLPGRARPAAEPLAAGDGGRRLGMNHRSPARKRAVWDQTAEIRPPR